MLIDLQISPIWGLAFRELFSTRLVCASPISACISVILGPFRVELRPSSGAQSHRRYSTGCGRFQLVQLGMIMSRWLMSLTCPRHLFQWVCTVLARSLGDRKRKAGNFAHPYMICLPEYDLLTYLQLVNHFPSIANFVAVRLIPIITWCVFARSPPYHPLYL